MKNNLDETPTGPLKRVLSKLMQDTSIKRKKRKRKPISQGCSLGSEQLGGGAHCECLQESTDIRARCKDQNCCR